MNRKVYQHIAAALQAIENCKRSGNTEWEVRHGETITALIRRYLPHGGGFDNGVKLDGASTPNRLVFDTAYHHMHDSGMYDGWSDHAVIVTPDLASGFDLRITGRDRNQIKEYIAECFHSGLSSDCDLAELLAA